MTTSQIFLVTSTFLACAVEMVEALTIVLATGITRGWRSALIGVGCDGRVRADGRARLVGIAGGDYWLPRRIDDPQIACHVLSACDKSSTTSDM